MTSQPAIEVRSCLPGGFDLLRIFTTALLRDLKIRYNIECRRNMHTLTVTTVGNSLGVVLPKEVTSRLELKKGDKIFLTKSPDGYRITPYDPEFEQQMNAARSIMKKRRNALRELAR